MKCLIFIAGAYGEKLLLQWTSSWPLILNLFFILFHLFSIFFLIRFFSLISLFFFFSISSDGWQHETQILTWVLSYDKIHSPEALSICSASAAMCISEVGTISYVFLVHHLVDHPEYMIFMWLCLRIAEHLRMLIQFENWEIFWWRKNIAHVCESTRYLRSHAPLSEQESFQYF